MLEELREGCRWQPDGVPCGNDLVAMKQEIDMAGSRLTLRKAKDAAPPAASIPEVCAVLVSEMEASCKEQKKEEEEEEEEKKDGQRKTQEPRDETKDCRASTKEPRGYPRDHQMSGKRAERRRTGT